MQKIKVIVVDALCPPNWIHLGSMTLIVSGIVCYLCIVLENRMYLSDSTSRLVSRLVEASGSVCFGGWIMLMLAAMALPISRKHEQADNTRDQDDEDDSENWWNP